ncbi:MAG: hypothetical protein IIU98_01580, partial [Ruminococcus sp.]|nr:hypothetical protein [Ruminococcus sp.]
NALLPKADIISFQNYYTKKSTDFQQIFLQICLFFGLFDDACPAAAKNFNKMQFATLFLENFVVEYVQIAG